MDRDWPGVDLEGGLRVLQHGTRNFTTPQRDSGQLTTPLSKISESAPPYFGASIFVPWCCKVFINEYKRRMFQSSSLYAKPRFNHFIDNTDNSYKYISRHFDHYCRKSLVEGQIMTGKSYPTNSCLNISRLQTLVKSSQ